MQPNEYYNIEVGRGALAIALYVSRLLCAAPLVVEPRGVRVSRLLARFGQVIVIFTGAVILTGLNFSFVRLLREPLIPRTLWSLSKIADLLISTVGACTARKRLHKYLQHLQCLDKINKELSDEVVTNKEIKTNAAAIINILIYFIVTVTIFGVKRYILKRYDDFSDAWVGSFLTFSLIVTLVTFLYMMQYLLLTLRVLFTLQRVNRHLERALQGNYDYSVMASENIHLKIRYLSFSYTSICEVIRESVEAHEILLILILIRNAMYTEWYFIHKDTTVTLHALISILLYFCRIIDFLTPISNVLFLIDTCHRVRAQMVAMEYLVRNSMLSLHWPKKVVDELVLFRRQMQLDLPSYCPMGICNLARPLIIKIVGSLISYLILLSQF